MLPTVLVVPAVMINILATAAAPQWNAASSTQLSFRSQLLEAVPQLGLGLQVLRQGPSLFFLLGLSLH